MNYRLTLVRIIFGLGLLVLVARLFYWQIYKGKNLSVEARNQYESGYLIDAARGDILADDGSWLVASTRTWLVYASIPDLSDTPKAVAEKLAPLFVKDPEDRQALLEEIDRLESLMSRDEVVWSPLKHKVSQDTRKKIEELKLDGIGFEEEESRYYPEASSAAQLLGFVGKNSEGEDQGYFGLEGYYNLSLSGKPGFLSRESDAAGVPILLGDTKEVSAIGGVDLLTNIDKTVQLILEKSLKEGMDKYQAKSGTAIIMNPRDGSILGMASFPSYDPVKYFDFSDEVFKNPAVAFTFEPGSIFKVIVMASALDAGVVEPDTVCTACSGPLKVDKYFIETWNNKYYKDSTMEDIIVHSDNVGMAFVGSKLGADKMYDYLRAFGIGELTGIDLQEEITPKLREKGTWNIVDLATASFGQGVAVTPIQMVRAVGAIANKGIIVKPQVVKMLVKDGWEEDIKPSGGKIIISEKAASEMTAMMVEAAKDGEAKWIYQRGFGIAGKTGTAQIPISGHYDAEKTIASFIGFAPFDDPQFVMLVTLREPQTSPWASETAAPVWYSIAKQLFDYLGIQPKN